MKRDLDILLREALKPDIEAGERVNAQLLSRAQEAGRRRKDGNVPKLAAALVCVCLLGTMTAFAAWKLLSAAKVAERVKDGQLSEAFQGEAAVKGGESQICGGYRVTFLGAAAGRNISSLTGFDRYGNLREDMLYTVVAIEREDGTPFADVPEENFFVSPYVQNLDPSAYNIATMGGGGYGEFVEEGVLYRLAEVSNLEMFADRKLYLGVSAGTFYDRDAFLYDAGTGELSRNPEFGGVNALFSLPLDPGKADPQAAKDYLKSLEEEWNAPDAAAEPNAADLEAEAWMAQVNGENLQEYARRIESTVQAVILGEDGFYRYSWEYGGGSGKGSFVPSMAPKGEAGELCIVGYSWSEAGVTDLLIETMTIEGDGTYTFALYEPIAE